MGVIIEMKPAIGSFCKFKQNANFYGIITQITDFHYYIHWIDENYESFVVHDDVEVLSK